MDDVKSNAAETSRVDKAANGDDPKLPKSEENLESTLTGTNSRTKNVNQQRKNLLANDLEKAQCNLRNAENDLEIAEHDLEETKDALKTTEKNLLEEMKKDEKEVEVSDKVVKPADNKDSEEEESQMVLEIKDDSQSNDEVSRIKESIPEKEKEPDINKEGPKIDEKDPVNERIDQESPNKIKDKITKDQDAPRGESLICLKSEKLINITELQEEHSEGQVVESKSPEVTVKSKEERKESKVEEPKQEVGIVGEPTAVTDLINEEELGVESTLSTDAKPQDHVAQWVVNSVKVEGRFSGREVNNGKSLPERKRANKRKERSEVTSRKRRRIVNHIIKRSIKCLNKMHAIDGNGANVKKVESAEKKEEEDHSRQSPQVPQSQQNGAALPEETAAAAADRLQSSVVKQESYAETPSDPTKKSTTVTALPKQQEDSRTFRSDDRGSRKRRSTEEALSTNGSTNSKKICIDQRQQLVSSLITGYENATAEELASRADVLRAELQALDELARAAEMEWNRVLTMRKLKEEAYLRIERRRQVINFMEGSDKLTINEILPPTLDSDWESRKSASNLSIKEKCGFPMRDEHGEGISQDNSGLYKSEKVSKSLLQQQHPVQNAHHRQTADARKQADALIENRQIGEGRQGPIVDVRSIIADYRLRHPETVPRSDHDCRGRRMRNNVNIGLGAGGAIIETGQNTDSRPSSTDSCKSNSNVDPNNSMSFKDVLVQFAKLSQQQGEPVKTPQNYPDVTLHPVAVAPTIQSPAPQQTGSLLHGILTKAQSPRPTTFSPTLARLLTAPERERSTPATTVTSHPNSTTQRILQAYHESNPVSISDLLSSSKARTEITITPVGNSPAQSHVNNMMHVDDVEEETAMMDERESRVSGKVVEDRDVSPRCQGCHERTAQYVCAGCGNQWYCSPECQAAAWDEHSEVCSG
ncbi:WD repeat-containing protein 87-like isoform X2 [Belonocnema kinseyi]|uniref:WD repeat-containing protein 87-like isoform X2 n=1 Tax=Belonocnema kinseyi TaxID=2817044 RepID=UPI00143CC518|nr:WD repeat-containing protein 87-like isoform X2 [Belonocnema kinseyi]